MITYQQKKWEKDSGWTDIGKSNLAGAPQLVLCFGGSALVSQKQIFDQIKDFYPDSHILLCSTAGEILGTAVSDNTISLTALKFEKTKIEVAQTAIQNAQESEDVGQRLAKMLKPDGLVHVMVFSEGLSVNGTAMVNGLRKGLPQSVSVTGGLSGDGSDFKHTYVGIDAPASEKNIALVGFYGESLKVGYGSIGGWDSFGPDRIITKSVDNVLYELDGESALELYKKYLGDKAAGLPATGLLFPLSLRVKSAGGTEDELVRTLLGIDEKTGGMIFAGDMPEGASAKLMKANFDRLIDGASDAADLSLKNLADEKPEVAVLVSCIGRKLVLRERIEEEVEAIRNIVGPDTALCGFYSYGELCPTAPTEKQCQLHNQTMTITVFKEE